jgi:hypothetical protein
MMARWVSKGADGGNGITYLGAGRSSDTKDTNY